MENRYLFRGKRTDNGEWEIGSLIALSDGKFEIANKCENPPDSDPMWGKCVITHYVDPSTICQCTGLKDKNGKLIWENDITKLALPDGEVRYFKVSFKKVIRKVLCHPDFEDDVAKVELNAVCFEWDGDELFPCIYEDGSSDVSNMEMAGNVFDNPELLEV